MPDCTINQERVQSFFIALGNGDKDTVVAMLERDAKITSHYLGDKGDDRLELFLENVSGWQLSQGYHQIEVADQYASRRAYAFGATYIKDSSETGLNVEVLIDCGKISGLHSYYVGTEPPPRLWIPPEFKKGAEPVK